MRCGGLDHFKFFFGLQNCLALSSKGGRRAKRRGASRCRLLHMAAATVVPKGCGAVNGARRVSGRRGACYFASHSMIA